MPAGSRIWGFRGTVSDAPRRSAGVGPEGLKAAREAFWTGRGILDRGPAQSFLRRRAQLL
eukprot:1409456-Pyramimonas_sp.AAC.1